MRNNVTVFVGGGSRLSRTPRVADTETRRCIAYSPQGLTGSSSEAWRQDLQGGKPGVFVSIDRMRPTVEWYGDKKPSNVYLFDGGEASVVPSAKIPNVAPGSHLIVPADSEADKQLSDFLSLCGGFTADVKASLLEAICEPDLRHRLARTERILAGLEKLEEQLEDGRQPTVDSEWQFRLKQAAPWALGSVVVILAAFIGWQLLIRERPWRQQPYRAEVARELTRLVREISGRDARAAEVVAELPEPDSMEAGVINPAVPRLLVWAAAGPSKDATLADALDAVARSRDLKAMILDAACRTTDGDSRAGLVNLGAEQPSLSFGECPEEEVDEQTIRLAYQDLQRGWSLKNVTKNELPPPPPLQVPRAIARLDRPTTPAKSPAFTLDVIGEGFTPEDRVRVGKETRSAEFVDATRLKVRMNDGDLAVPGNVEVTVVGPDDKKSNTAKFVVTAERPPKKD